MNSVKYIETIKVADGKAWYLEYHQKRLNRTVKESNIVLKDIIKPPGKGLYRCRVVYDAQGYDEVEYFSYKKRNIQSLKLVFDDTIEYENKYYERGHINALFEQRGMCDDILIVKNGLLSDTSIANIAFEYENRWITPKKPLLLGTTRQRYIDNKKLFEDDIKPEDLNKFSRVALMNAMINFDIIQHENIKEIIC